jgi:hypothetical protein
VRRAAKRVLLHPALAVPGFWLVTALAALWGAALSRGRVRRVGGLLVASGMPRWSFGRGGTTIGAVYLTGSNTSASVLRHEEAHRRQWRRYGLVFIPLYLAAGRDARANRFEIAAGLRDGGYDRPTGTGGTRGS